MRLLIFLTFLLSAYSFQASANLYHSENIKETSDTFGHISDKEITDPEWKTLQDSLFTLKYPATWEMNHTGQKGLSFVVISPLEGETDKFRENLSFVIQSMKNDDSTLKDFVEDNTSQILDMIANSKMLKNEEKMIGKIKYREVVYTGTQGNMELINTQRYIYHGDDAYVFTFTRIAGSDSNFEADGVKIMNSLKFK